MLLTALTSLRALGLPHPSAAAVLEATGATKTRAYALAAALQPLLSTLERPVGRPAKPTTVAGTNDNSVRLAELTKKVLAYLYEQPGAMERRSQRSNVSTEFRQFVVDLCLENHDIDTEQTAAALCLPASTLREWIRKTSAAAIAPPAPAPTPALAPTPTPALVPAPDLAPAPVVETAARRAIEASKDIEVQTVLDQHRTWQGDFKAFCKHLRRHHKVSLGDTSISSILAQAGERIPKKRPGRSPDDKAMRAAFCNFFPSAQWTADGTEISVEVGQHVFAFNLELTVDTCSSAFVGLDIREQEDAGAVIASFNEGVSTTGGRPIAFLVDNKACNLCSEVDTALGDTLCIPATCGRPQTKGHVEGAFGLFAQHAPPLRLDATTDKGRACELVELCTRIFFGALNMRPRKRRGGLSRIDIYNAAPPTAEQIEHAKASLQARLDQQRRARATLRERQCPEKRAAVSDAFRRLDLADPTGNILDACARHPLHAILDGIAIFEGKKRNASLPDDLNEPARYLLGIIRNVDHEREGMAIAQALWSERLRARDRIFVPLLTERERIILDSETSATTLKRLVDRALKSDRAIEQHFWMVSIVEQILAHAEHERHGLFTHTARRIHTTYAETHEKRLAATRFIADSVLPVS